MEGVFVELSLPESSLIVALQMCAAEALMPANKLRVVPAGNYPHDSQARPKCDNVLLVVSLGGVS
jgi:hypothetical protein